MSSSSQLRFLSRIQSKTFASPPSSSITCTLAASAAAAYLYHHHHTIHADAPTKNSTPRPHPHIGIIEIDFMDKLASKPYLRYHNPNHHRDSLLTSTIQTTKKLWGSFARNDAPVVNTNRNRIQEEEEPYWWGEGGSHVTKRPRGVPNRLRILAIDVPEFREVLGGGECRVDLSKIYPDGVAPPKVIRKQQQQQQQQAPNATSKNKGETDGQKDLRVMQKSLARSLVRCRHKTSKHIGVDLLEASVYDLNPHNMRRTYQFGTFRYDPAKYAQDRSRRRNPRGDPPMGADLLQRRRTVNTLQRQRRSVVATSSSKEGDEKDEKGYADPEEEMEVESHGKEEVMSTEEIISSQSVKDGDVVRYGGVVGGGVSTSPGGGDNQVLATEEDEVDAPWNQYAWIEEMNIRIRGFVPFAGPIESSSFLTQKIFGTCYRRTVHSSRSVLHWFIPSFLSGEKVGGEEGIDGDYGRKRNKRVLNWASSKPHAVIADGSAMQRVPGSLRYLTKCCLEADVPLFIVNDPRVWGGNTHSDLESAAKDVRATIKARIVANALAIKEGKMFERGRMLGRIEAGAKWQAKDLGRKTRQAFEDAANLLRKKKDDDWSNLDGKELMKRLQEKNVIRVENRSEGDDFIIDKGLKGAFQELCRLYSEQQEKMKQNQGKESKNETKDVASEEDIDKTE